MEIITNMKKQNKISLLLSLILAMAIFATACGSKAVTTGTDTTSSTETVSTDATADSTMQPATDDTKTDATATDADASTATDTDAVTTTGDATVTDDAAVEKTITVDVVYTDKTSDSFVIKTKESTLRAALEQENLVQGTESDYGLYIDTVNGVTADADKQEWWCLTKGGEMWSNGVDTTDISDGDQYELTLTTGW